MEATVFIEDPALAAAVVASERLAAVLKGALPQVRGGAAVSERLAAVLKGALPQVRGGAALRLHWWLQSAWQQY